MKPPILFLFLTLAAVTPAAAQTISPAYEGGAIIRNLAGPSDKTSRTISMKLYCDKSASGSVYSKLGIFDVTEDANIYGQYFKFGDAPLDLTFRLNDRFADTRNYRLMITAGKGMPITFGRPGNEE